MKIGFRFHNQAWMDTISGAPLSIWRPQRATFLASEGEPIALEMTMTKFDNSEAPDCSRVTMNCQSDISETGMMELTQDQYYRIANATTLAVKIDGSNRVVIYEVKDIDPVFFANLKSFYQSHIAK